MNNRYIAPFLTGTLTPVFFSALGADVTTPLPFRDFQNIVSQQLAVAQSERNAEALQETMQLMKDFTNVEDETYRRYERPVSGDFLSLQLSILNIALEMQDKTFSPKKIKVGINGKVPWPSDRERPKRLSEQPLWKSGQNPEDYKTMNPELYAFYKPLYDENIRLTKLYKREGVIKSIIWDLLRTVRSSLEYARQHQKEDVKRYQRYVSIVKDVVKDEQIQKDFVGRDTRVSSSKYLLEMSTAHFIPNRKDSQWTSNTGGRRSELLCVVGHPMAFPCGERRV